MAHSFKEYSPPWWAEQGGGSPSIQIHCIHSQEGERREMNIDAQLTFSVFFFVCLPQSKTSAHGMVLSTMSAGLPTSVNII